MRTARLLSVVGVVLMLAARGAAGQSFQGALRGAVKDAQGVVPGVTVQMVNEANNVSRDTVTNDRGEYSFPAVDPATYSVKASVSGFKTFERHGVRIGTQQFLTLDIVLEVGQLAETITVTGEAPLIETATASTGDVMDARTLEAIPTAGRSVFLLANLSPTVQTSENSHWNRMQDQVGNSAVSVGGGARRGNNYLVDGFPVTDLQNRASTNPSMEAIEEMKVQIHTYDAEMGRTGGGVFNMTAKTGANDFHVSGYGVARPERWVDQLLIPRLQNKPNVPEHWVDGGGGGGGPIVKNKTFFWIAGEAYVDNQPQQNTFLVPTAAERSGDFSGLIRNGKPVTLVDPLTGQPFPGNIIPANRINPVGQKIMSYMPPADTAVDNGSSNFSMTDLLPNKASQWTTKVDHHFNSQVAVSGFVLRQVTHEANANYNPVNKFVGGTYQLDRVINTVVLNNTYILSPSMVLTVRGGYNHFEDDYNLPVPFDATTLWPNNPALTKQMSDTNRFPTTSTTGYKSTGWSNRSADGYYQYGANGTLSKLAGAHNWKFGGDYRVIGDNSRSYGPSTGSYTFTDGFSGNAAANMLLGYFTTASIPLNATFDGFVRYYAGYVQDDWRATDRLTINYGVRLERETGLMEKSNQIGVGFDTGAVSPLDSQVTLLDPITGARRQITGGLVFAGVNGAPTVQGNQPALKAAPRVGVVYSFDEKTVMRGGYGMFWSPWNYPAAGTTSWGQIGYSATTLVQNQGSVPAYTMSDPFPAGLVQPSGNTLGLLTGTGGDIYFINPAKGAPRVQQYSVDIQRELPGNVSVTAGYTGSRGSNLSWGGSNNGTNSYININQLDPKYQSLPSTTTPVANPFYLVAAAGQLASQKTVPIGQLLRPFPQFNNIYMLQSTGAHSLYHAAIFEVRKRVTGVWGGNISYTWSRLYDNQFGEANYYSSNPGLQNMYTVIPGSPYYNPDQEYGRSLLDSPHKLVVAATVRLPFGDGRKWLSASRTADALLGGWAITPVITMQSGFPIGVTQYYSTAQPFLMGGNPRPNVVPGQSFLAAGDVTDRITASKGSDNLYLNKGAFSAAPANQFGNAPRMLPGVFSPWRDNVDLAVAKEVKTGGGTRASIRIEALNLLNLVQWAAPASMAFGNPQFSMINNQANNMRMIQFTFRFSF